MSLGLVWAHQLAGDEDLGNPGIGQSLGFTQVSDADTPWYGPGVAGSGIF